MSSSAWSKGTCLALLLLGNAVSVCNAQGTDDPPATQDDMVVPLTDEQDVAKNPAASGSWSEVYESPVVPVAGALMPDGRVLVWAALSKDDYGVPPGTPHPGQTATAVFDPATGESKDYMVTKTGHDMFCPGISYLPSGQIVVTGGKLAEKTSIFDPVAEDWIPGADMNVGRGYQSSVLLSNKEIFVLGGSWSGEDTETFKMEDGNSQKWGQRGGEVTVTDESGDFTWKKLDGIPSDPVFTDDREGPYRGDNHLWIFAWKNASVFHAGPSKAMHWFYPMDGENGSYNETTTRPGDDAMCGSFAMYDAEKGLIMTAGGAPSYTEEMALGDSALITLPMDSVSAPTVEELPPMKQPRSFASTVILPDGKVLITGGMKLPLLFKDDGAYYEPEIWDPATKEFTLLAPMAIPRTYHSIALLLKDGRVVTGGGGLCGDCKGEYNINHLDMEIFTPPYLYAQDGSLAERPKVVTDRLQAVNGDLLRVWTNMPAKMISLVRFGSTTHAVNTDQRRIEMCGPNSKPCEALPKGSCPEIGKNKKTLQDLVGLGVPGAVQGGGLDAGGVDDGAGGSGDDGAAGAGDDGPADTNGGDGPGDDDGAAGGAAGNDDDDDDAGAANDDGAPDDADAGPDGNSGAGGTRRRSLRSHRYLLQDAAGAGNTAGAAAAGDTAGPKQDAAGAACYEYQITEDPGVAVPGYYLVFVINNDGVPSVGETLLVS